MRPIITNIIAASVSVFVVGPIVFMAIDREPPYTRDTGAIHPANPQPGDAIEAEWKIHTNRTCKPASNRNVIRQIVDSHNTVWDFDGVPSVYGRELSAKDSPDRLVRVFALPPAIA